MRVAIYGQSKISTSLFDLLTTKDVVVKHYSCVSNISEITNIDLVFILSECLCIDGINIPTVVVDNNSWQGGAATKHVSSQEVLSLLPSILEWGQKEKKAMDLITDKIDRSSTKVSEFLKRVSAVIAIVVLLTVFVAGCKSTVHQRDEITIRNWSEAKVQYMQDVAAAAGKLDPADLTEADFPILDGGYSPEIQGLDWEVYQARLEFYDSALYYEQQKRDPDDPKESPEDDSGDLSSPSE